jgi:hypothetical protein
LRLRVRGRIVDAYLTTIVAAAAGDPEARALLEGRDMNKLHASSLCIAIALSTACAVDPTEPSASREEAAATTCPVPVPKAPVCNVSRCTVDGWVFWPVAAGAACTLPGGGAGVCDGGRVAANSIEPLQEGSCISSLPAYKNAVVPLDFVYGALNLALVGTTIQVSHTTGTPAPVPEDVSVCTVDQAAFGDCVEKCTNTCTSSCGACKSSCLAQATKCVATCETVSALSYVEWGPGARTPSPLGGGGFACSATTCPSCSTPQVIDLPNQPIDVPPYSGYGATCKANDWVFSVTNAKPVNVTAGAGALTLEVQGAAVDPAVQCTNGPDMHVGSIGLKLTLTPSVDLNGHVQIKSVGQLDTTFTPAWWATPIDWFADFDSTIKGAVQQSFSGMLNQPDNEKQLAGMILALVDGWLTGNGYPAIGKLYALSVVPGGLAVKYTP